MDFVNITAEVEEAVRESGVQEGLCLVNAMHITVSVFINDDEPGLHEDYKRWLEQLAPVRREPRALPPQPHRRGQRRRAPQAPDHGPRGGGGDHRRGSSTSGRWEQIFYGEFDGKRAEAGAGQDQSGSRPRQAHIARCSRGTVAQGEQRFSGIAGVAFRRRDARVDRVLRPTRVP